MTSIITSKIEKNKKPEVKKDNLKKLIETIKERLDENHESVKKIKHPKLFLSSLEELDSMVGMHRFKNEIADKTKELIQNINDGETKAGKLHSVIYSPPGTGKCFKKGTQIMMLDGTSKNVEDIIIGDKVMGDDSKVRNVLDLGRGRDLMYEITNSLNERFVCNKEHILCLKYKIDILLRDSKRSECFEVEYYDPTINMSIVNFYSYKSQNKNYIRSQVNYKIDEIKEKLNIVQIAVKDFLELNNKNNLYLYKVPLHFDYSKIDDDPYIFGKFFNGKDIPREYLFNTFNNRDKLFTGICDNLGKFNRVLNRYEFIYPLKDLIFLARSLGFRTEICSTSLYVYTTDNCLMQDFNVEEVGTDDYYGFVLDGNHRFLLSDFTVSHNTSCGIILAKIFYSLGYLKTESNVKKKESEEMDVETMQYIQLMLYLIIIFIPLFYKLFGVFKILYKEYPIILVTSATIIVLYIYMHHLKKEIEQQVILDDIADGNVDPRNIISVVSRGEFVAQYLGQTSIKTRKLLEANRGKVLFIDEAYTLYNTSGGHGDMYGDEALAEINKFMSENEDSITIVFAGYEDKMRNGIFKIQPGLARRCQYHFEIDDYTPEELSLIFNRQIIKMGYEIDNIKDVEKEIGKNMMHFKSFGGDTERLMGYVITEKKQQTFDLGNALLDNVVRKEDVLAGIEKLKQNDITTKKKKTIFEE